MSEAFGEVIEKLRRSTVQIRVQRSGSGSGVIWSHDGRIVTNAHVLGGRGGPVEAQLWDGRRLRASVVSRDLRRDLATLQVEASGLPAATTGDSGALRVAELVIAVGNPLGFIGAASTGVVHQVTAREQQFRGFDNRAWVVSQLRLAPGNSGGPLANARGEVVGINTMIAGGLAFAIPSNSVVQFLRTPANEPGGLGVIVRPIPVGNPARQTALVILEVVAQSPADRASLLQGDLLLGAGGKPFRTVQDLETAIQAARGGILELQFRRGASGNVRTVAAQLAPAAAKAA